MASPDALEHAAAGDPGGGQRHDPDDGRALHVLRGPPADLSVRVSAEQCDQPVQAGGVVRDRARRTERTPALRQAGQQVAAEVEHVLCQCIGGPRGGAARSRWPGPSRARGSPRSSAGSRRGPGAGRRGNRAPRRARRVDRRHRGVPGKPCGRRPTGRDRDGPPTIAGAVPPAAAWACPTGWRRTAGRLAPGDRSAAAPTSPRRASQPTTGRSRRRPRSCRRRSSPRPGSLHQRKSCRHPATAHRQSGQVGPPGLDSRSNVCSDECMRWDAQALDVDDAIAARHAVDPRTAPQRPGAGVPRADLPRGPREERAESRPGRLGDAIPLDDQSLSGMQSYRAFTALLAQRMNGSNSIPEETSTRRSSSRRTWSTCCAASWPGRRGSASTSRSAPTPTRTSGPRAGTG